MQSARYGNCRAAARARFGQALLLTVGPASSSGIIAYCGGIGARRDDQHQPRYQT